MLDSYAFIFLSSVAATREMMVTNPGVFYLHICVIVFMASFVAVLIIIIKGQSADPIDSNLAIICPFIIALFWPIGILISVFVLIGNYVDDRLYRDSHAADRDTDDERLYGADAQNSRCVLRDATDEEITDLQESNSDSGCPICLDSVDMPSLGDVLQPSDLDICLTTCQHIFHWNCIKDWLPRDGSCPLCRSDQQLIDLVFFL